MQIYHALDNITNKHPVAEREDIPHHLLGHIPWKDEYSVKQFEDEATSIVDDIHSRGKVPILVGGTHYYIQSLLFKDSMIASSEIPVSPLTLQQKAILDSTPAEILNHLKQVDPLVAGKFHPNDTRRLRRALEIYFTTNRKPSEIYAEQKNSLRYRSLVLWVWCDKPVLDQRLDARVDQMVRNGLYDEVRDMFRAYESLSQPVDLERGVWQVIGFRQFLPWLKNEVESPNSGIEAMKLATRKYATRQTKWISKKLLTIYSGDVALLDSTDLTKWHENVGSQGVTISRDFLKERAYSVPLAPAELERVLEPRDTAFNADKWKHFECPLCAEAYNQTCILIGQDAWNVHVNSRKHRSAVKRKWQQENGFERRCSATLKSEALEGSPETSS
jgi:tRNA dimethylallyltransferase